MDRDRGLPLLNRSGFIQIERWRICRQKEVGMDFEGFSEDDNEDVMIRMEHEDGTKVTFLTAPPEVFTQRDELEPLVCTASAIKMCASHSIATSSNR